MNFGCRTRTKPGFAQYGIQKKINVSLLLSSKDCAQVKTVCRAVRSQWPAVSQQRNTEQCISNDDLTLIFSRFYEVLTAHACLSRAYSHVMCLCHLGIASITARPLQFLGVFYVFGSVSSASETSTCQVKSRMYSLDEYVAGSAVPCPERIYTGRIHAIHRSSWYARKAFKPANHTLNAWRSYQETATTK